ncbi:MAG: RlpA-like double-psi beta-barrel domain-containing protein [Thiofilum sp.]|uniref:RlpA-like double-psi beta-barrel domain-containing protein n=1 Tax=Thiofilum sp. TaxID=2212733 RepID=UPI0025D36E35|nr:RlpA-like double-psi beta-barrel domain-containing protein [Thiofilum sp.]MBK8452535.1 SPOR domain-containing protein [Thiofilum sp.]
MLTIINYASRCLIGCGIFYLSACSVFEGESLEGKTVEAIPILKPTHKASAQCGNPAAYEAQGQVFKVLSSGADYREQGWATVYQAQQAGQATAGCETYDPQAYSAAHRTLPIPSDVRITRLDTGRSIVVRVNDRLPSDPRALIQVSQAAARALGLNEQGSVAVIVEGLDKPTVQDPQALYIAPTAGLTNTNKSVSPEVKAQAQGKLFYVIVGSYPTQAQAVDTYVRLAAAGLRKSEMATAQFQGREVHQVRIGPLYTQGEIDNVKNTLEGNGLAKFRVIGING